MTWRPFQEIAEGVITDASFAASFWPVYTGRGVVDKRYTDPVAFFERTYFSEGLRSTLLNVVRRIVRGEGDPVILLSTAFGGGKTHTLLAIYHLLRDPASSLRSRRLRESLGEDTRLVEELLKGRRRVYIVALDGSAVDLAYLRRGYGYPTYWRFLLEPLARKADARDILGVIRSYSDPRLAPGYEPILRLLMAIEEDGAAAVFLLDELSELLRRLSNIDERFADAMVSFLDALARAIAATRYSVAVYSLAEKHVEAYEEYNRRLLEALEASIGRLSRPKSIIGKDEAAYVLQSALLEEIDRSYGEALAKRYHKVYVENRGELPSHASTQQYLEEMTRSYPFHPHYVRLAYAELAQLPEFQATRDILRLTARILHSLYRRGRNNDFILPADVDAQDPDILSELLDRHGYLSLRRAVDADRDALTALDEEYAHMGLSRIASSVYNAVLMKSVAGKPMDIKELRLSTIRPALTEKAAVIFIDQVAARLEKELTYFHRTPGGYIIRDRPNLRRLVERLAGGVTDSEARKIIHDRLTRLAGRTRYPDVETVVWPQAPSQIPDNVNLKIIYLDPALCLHRCEDILNEYTLYTAPGSYRRFKNTLVYLKPSIDVYRRLLEDTRRLTACKRLAEQSEQYGLSDEDAKQLREICREFEEKMMAGLQALYAQVCYPVQASIVENRVSFLCDAVNFNPYDVGKLLALLEERQKVIRSISPSLLKSIVINYYEKLGREALAREVAEVFAADVEKPYILNLYTTVYRALEELAGRGEIIVIREGKPLVPFNRGITHDDLLAPCTPEVASRLNLEYIDGSCKKPVERHVAHKEAGAVAEATTESRQLISASHQASAITATPPARTVNRLSKTITSFQELVNMLQGLSGSVLTLDIRVDRAIGQTAYQVLQLLSIIVGRLTRLFEKARLTLVIIASSDSGRATVEIESSSDLSRVISAAQSMVRTLGSYLGKDVVIETARVEFEGEAPAENIVKELGTRLLQRYTGIRMDVRIDYLQ